MARPEAVMHGWMYGQTFKIGKSFPQEKNEALKRAGDIPYQVGEIVKVTMVSSLGDCGITRDLNASMGYDLRVKADFLEKP